ncbi:Two-component response regulator-like APRR7 [Glycine max]|uniref:CCT domain-containing protein n=1 Tax=Glycine max TaxID=3847 RepID=A0A0R0HYC8_SOYBN|nr:Two-component response regulator-like APRR7 [Glycine max]
MVNYINGVPVKTAGSQHSNAPDVGPSKFSEQINRGQLDLNCENQSSKLRCKGLSLSDAITSTCDSQMHSGEFEALNKKPKSSDIENKGTNNDEELPSLELSLKRLRGVEDADITIQDDRNVLRRSDQSAFSRYNAASNTKKSPTGCVGSNSPYNNSLEVTKKDSSRDIQSHSCGNPPNQNSNGASNNIDMGSTTNNAYAKSAVMSEPAGASTTKCLYQTSAFQPVKNSLVCTSQQVVLNNTEDMSATILAPPKLDRHKDSAALDFHLHCENHNCIADNMKHQLPPDHDAESIKKMATAAPHCGSSNVEEVLVEGNVGNHSINRSVSGSNNGSNGQNGSSTAVNAGGTNTESNNGLTGNSGSGDASGSGSANRVDQNKTSQREVALTKFRQKRKERRERCFHKKVRYQSRKRLAEQRPRFRGQFVRQTSNENASEATTDS